MVKKKTVLLISDVTQAGGVNTYLTSLAEEAVSNGWEVKILLDNKLPFNRKSEMTYSVIRGAIYHRDYSEIKIKQFILQILQDFSPALVHVSCGSPWSCIAVREIVLDQGIPLQFTEQYVPNDLILSPVQLKRLSRIYHRSQKIIFVHEHNRNVLLSALSLPLSDHIITTHNAVPVRSIQKQALPSHLRQRRLEERISNGDPLKLLCIGRFSRQKGFDVALSALKQMRFEYLSQVHLSIYGEGPEEEKLREQVFENHLGSHVSFFPWSNQALEVFHQFDLVIQPSRSEGLPFLGLEALASSIPVIASDIPPHQAMTQSGRFAALFRSEDPGNLSLVLEKWIKSPFSFFNCYLDGTCSKWLLENFNSEIAMSNTVQIWEELCISHPREFAIGSLQKNEQ